MSDIVCTILGLLRLPIHGSSSNPHDLRLDSGEGIDTHDDSCGKLKSVYGNPPELDPKGERENPPNSTRNMETIEFKSDSPRTKYGRYRV